MKKFSRSIAHTFLFAVFPILALLAFNISQLQFANGMRALVVLLLLAGLLLIVLRILISNWQRSALVISIISILLFSYGPVYDYLKQLEIIEFVLGRHRLLLPTYGLLLLLGVYFAVRTSKLTRLTEFANVTALILVVIPLIQIVNFEVLASRPQSASTSLLNLYSISLPEDREPPDVYYIVLDGYARDDVLLKLGYDNQPFLGELEDLGFAVSQCSRSNYAITQLSLTSSMNMDYLDEMGIGLLSDALLDRADFDTTIRRDSRVIRIFEEFGYTTVGFETGFRWTEFETADYFFSPSLTWLDRLRKGQDLTELESLLLFNSIARVLFEENIALPELANADLVVAGGREHHDLITYVLNQLRNLRELEGPKFVFAHMVVPHEPYVFGSDGSFSPTEDEEIGYLSQVEFINREILSVLEILVDNPNPPIIILQSDHGGPGIEPPERMYNLEALHFPGQEDGAHFEYMTPVNIFRFVFSTYFGSNLEQVENISLASNYAFPFRFTEVAETREECIP